jgi:hypothetical protein
LLLLVLAGSNAVARSPGPSMAAGPAPLPVRAVSGSCTEPGDGTDRLADAVALDVQASEGPTVYVSLTGSSAALDTLLTSGGSVLVGGSDAASAVACADIPATEASEEVTVLLLGPLHGSAHAGAVVLRSGAGGASLEIVLVAEQIDVSGSSMPTAPASSPVVEASGLSPVRSVTPGTSGAPPFSPLPQASG